MKGVGLSPQSEALLWRGWYIATNEGSFLKGSTALYNRTRPLGVSALLFEWMVFALVPGNFIPVRCQNVSEQPRIPCLLTLIFGIISSFFLAIPSPLLSQVNTRFGSVAPQPSTRHFIWLVSKHGLSCGRSAANGTSIQGFYPAHDLVIRLENSSFSYAYSTKVNFSYAYSTKVWVCFFRHGCVPGFGRLLRFWYSWCIVAWLEVCIYFFYFSFSRSASIPRVYAVTHGWSFLSHCSKCPCLLEIVFRTDHVISSLFSIASAFQLKS